jgi:hypothetical protein
MAHRGGDHAPDVRGDVGFIGAFRPFGNPAEVLCLCLNRDGLQGGVGFLRS